MGGSNEKIRSGEVSVYTIPTDAPEADGTFRWDKTTLVLVQLRAGDTVGMGWTYADDSTAKLAQTLIREIAVGCSPFDIPKLWMSLVQAVRNLGREGIASMAIAAIDSAAWDLKAKLLGVPLVSLLGRVRDGIAVYGSGGFTSYSIEQLQNQMEGWKDQGFRMMKMKIGSNPDEDLYRVHMVRQVIGDEPDLFVDANGAYSRKQALDFAERCADFGVTWFEEPVSADDLEGLRLLRDRAPGGMDIVAGEYGYTPKYFQRMLQAGAVDVLQADATRCGGITGFLAAGSLAFAAQLPLSAHCAPYLHVAACCSVPSVRHIEYFHDHARIANMLFDGVEPPKDGILYPNTTQPGIGLKFKRQDAARFSA